MKSLLMTAVAMAFLFASAPVQAAGMSDDAMISKCNSMKEQGKMNKMSKAKRAKCHKLMKGGENHAMMSGNRLHTAGGPTPAPSSFKVRQY